jgi:hypothetical protein
MLDVLPQSEGKLLVLHASGKLTDRDYHKVLIPRLERIIAEYGKASVVFEMDEAFRGWELGAAWEDMRLGLQHHEDFEKLAVVGGPRWVGWGTRIAAHFMSGEMRTFPADALAEALAWARGDETGSERAAA